MFYIIVAESIKKNFASCEVVFNMVPKVWAHSDIYCQLIPNEDDNQPYYEVVPRIGTFEVSVNGVVSLFLYFICPFIGEVTIKYLQFISLN